MMNDLIVFFLQGFFVFFIGLTFGSFFNVVIYRLPLGISIVTPPSHCPNCRTRIRALHNIPLFSYIYLGGMCNYCSYPISIRYPVIEMITGILFLLFYRVYYFDYYGFLLGFSPFDPQALANYLLTLLFFSILLIVSIIDLDLFIIPDSLSIAGALFYLIITPIAFNKGFLNVFAGFAAGFLFYFILWIITGGQGVGLGDAKLMAMIGAFFGLSGVFPIIFLSSFIGTIVGLFLIFTRGRSRKTPIPFGPFLALGSFIYFFISDISIPQMLNLH